MKERKYTRLRKEEHVKIKVFVELGKSISYIARHLGRSLSTIRREIKRGKSDVGWGYTADQAQFRSDFYKYTRRINIKLEGNHELLVYVKEKLGHGWTPEQISQRLKLEYPDRPGMWISYESIYKYIYGLANSSERGLLINLLPFKKAKQCQTPSREGYKGKIQDRVPISERPPSAEDRKEPCHWEGDLIVGKGHKSAIGTLVERTTRYTIIVLLESMKSGYVVEAFALRLKALGWGKDNSLTYDNGVEMSAHKIFTELTGLFVYFAEPNSSWQRGTNENTNGLIRRVFKKG